MYANNYETSLWNYTSKCDAKHYVEAILASYVMFFLSISL